MLTPSAWSSTSTSTHFHASHFCLLAEGEVAHLLVSKSPLAEEQIQSTLVACDASLLLAFNVFDCPIPTPLNLQPVLSAKATVVCGTSKKPTPALGVAPYNCRVATLPTPLRREG